MSNFLDLVGINNVQNSLVINKKYPIILGSSSPRRVELLKNVVKDFEVIKPKVDENSILDKSFTKYKDIEFTKKAFLACSDIALAKAQKIYENEKNSIIISADTTVITANKILGKPLNEKDAYETLISLLGKYHYVATAVCIYINNVNYDLFYSVTGVKFADENKHNINYIKEYANSGEPLDKAGSYGIQQVGSYLIESIFGDYFNIVGFPIVEIRRRLYENFN